MLEYFLGKTNERKLQEMSFSLEKILQIQSQLKKLSDGDLLSISKSLKDNIRSELTDMMPKEERIAVLDKYLNQAFALAKEVIKREKGFELHDVQVIGGIALHKGEVAQLATGEGKTLMAVLPAYLNALAGNGVHVITPNPYLAERDREGNTKIFSRLGISTGFVPSGRSMKDIDKIKEAFAADISYVSAHDLGFNYLHDGLAYDAKNMVNDTNRYTYAIIDEVDSVLIDDAQVPLVISGIREDEKRTDLHGAIKRLEDNYIAESARAQIADDAIFQIYKQHYQLREDGHKGIVMFAPTNEYYDNAIMTALDGRANLNIADNYALVVNKVTGEFYLTDLGHRIVSKYYIGPAVEQIFAYDLDYILSIQDNYGDRKYKENIDYTIDAYGKLRLTDGGYDKVLRDRDHPAINDLFDGREYSKEFNNDSLHLDNALTAYFSLEKDKDYVLTTVTEGKDFDPRYNSKKITLVTGGRTAEGRVYSKGLQLAIEKKEKRFNAGKKEGKAVRIIETKEVPELASISPAMLFSMYKNIGGMTGTSAIEAFEDLYNWSTLELPKNVEYERNKRKERGEAPKEKTIWYEGRYTTKPSGLQKVQDIFYFSVPGQRTGEEAKIARLMQEIKMSQLKGQPVLISTTSVKESELIHKAILANLKIDVPLLNANTKNEAEIIANAGKKGAITISTEMAGRGTDIKLGGEEDYQEFRDIYRQLLTSEYQKFTQRTPNFTKEERERSFKETMMNQIHQHASLAWEEQKEKTKNEIIMAGGLKVISVGHFRHNRVDRQLVGRTARQDDPGEAIFISSESDMTKLALYEKDYAHLIKEAKANGKGYVSGEALTNLIRKQQNRFESLAASSIKQTLETEAVIQELRLKFRRQQDQLKQTEDYKANIEFMIEQSVKLLIAENQKRSINSKTKLSNKVIDFPSLANEVEEYLGISLPDISKNKTAKDLHIELSRRAIDKHRAETRSLSREEYNQEYSPIVMDEVANIWQKFNESVEEEKFQQNLYAITQYDKAKEMESRLRANYNNIVQSSKVNIASNILTGNKKDYLKARQTKEMLSREIEVQETVKTEARRTVKNIRTGSSVSVLHRPTKLSRVSVPLEIKPQEKAESIEFDSSRRR